MAMLSALLFAGAEPACKQSANSGSAPLGTAQRFVYDPMLKRTWAILTDCRHSDWPPQAAEVVQPPDAHQRKTLTATHLLAAKTSTAMLQTVQPGSRLDLWAESPARIRLSGIALERATTGQPIRVRVERMNTILYGVVSGPHSVRLEFNTSTWRRP